MSMRMATAEREAFYQALAALMKQHLGRLDSAEMLAIVANSLGKIIALQDQRKFSSAQVMETVARNIEAGNQHMIDELHKTKGSA